MEQLTTSFSALGTTVFVGVRRPRDLAIAHRLAEVVLDDVDQVCSRFRADSDLSRVNAHAGSWVEVDPLLVEAVRTACAAAAVTHGLVSPLLGRPLLQLGYDRDFRLLRELGDVPDLVDVDPEPPAPDAWRHLETGATTVRVPAGTALDLGATGKAWAADLIASAYDDAGLGTAIVSVGGDVRIASPDGVAWPVAVSERPGAAPEALVLLERGGLATSSTQVRRWSRQGVRRHHLLDPRTGQPTSGRWRTVTAIGDSCVAANTATTAALVLGDDAVDWLDEHRVAARLVDADGAVELVGAWPRDEVAA